MTSTHFITTEDTQQGRIRRLTLIGALYCTQNLSLGFFTYAFLTIAQSKGVSLAAIGSAAGVALFITLKFLWAPLVDRFGSKRLGHYRVWLLATQSLLGLGVASLAFFDPAQHFAQLLVIFAFLFICAGTQDIAADAVATRLLAAEERGVGNGIQSAGAAVSQVVGGGVLLVVYNAAGWHAATLVLALFTVLPLPFIVAWHECDNGCVLPTKHATLRSIATFFSRSAVRWWCLVLIPAYTIGFTIAYNLVRPILVNAGWDEARIGYIVVIAGSGVGILSGVAAGYIISFLGRKRALLWLGLVQVLATFAVLPMAYGFTSEWLVFGVVAVSNAAVSASFAIVYTVSMGLTRPESAGTDFTWFTTIGALSMVVAAGSGMAAAGTFGFVPVVLTAGVLSALGLLVTVALLGRVLD